METYICHIATPLGGSRCSVVHHRRLHALVVGCASNDNTKNRRPFSSAAGAGVLALSSLSAGQIFAEGEDGCVNLVEADGPPETAVVAVGDTQGGNDLTRSPRRSYAARSPSLADSTLSNRNPCRELSDRGG